MFLCWKLQSEDKIEIIVADVAGVAGQDCAGSGPVQTNLLDVDVVLFQLGPHQRHEVAQLHLQCGEVSSPMNRNHLVHQITQSVDLLV